MARMQSKKHRRLLDFGKPPGSAPSHLTSQGPSQAPLESPTLDMQTSSSASKGGLAKIKRFFHLNFQSHQITATERAHSNTDVGPLEQMEQSPAPGTEVVCHLPPPPHAMSLVDPLWTDPTASRRDSVSTRISCGWTRCRCRGESIP
ncbi:hypothetical protein F5J12DRAFT_786299 [Pisolithus orientalis]|uniref:uncharacterized protein n=1 Tax=Pisolithus orientalis TaxID=936130 RepID=UPI002224FA6D|nr:uncharacterized protein F5J12DRAFT_786299 [Pisolithus orientalis]KAI5991756.1 hypothetical protein F5J12DRAFT_786299 [Pisolithus orientalis]